MSEWAMWIALEARPPKSFRREAVKKLANNSVDVIFVGSSHIYTAVNPGQFPVSAINLADSGLNYEIAELLIDRYWERVADARLVVLELDSVPMYSDTIALRNGDYRDFWDWGLPSSYLPISGWERFAADLEERWAPTRFGSLWHSFIAQSQKTDVDEMIGPGFHGRNKQLDSTSQEAFFAALGSEYDERIIGRNLQALDRILTKLGDERIHVYFVRPPMHVAYWQHESTSVREAIVLKAVKRIGP